MTTDLSAAEAVFNYAFYRSFLGWSGEMLKLTSFLIDDQPHLDLTDVYGFGAWSAQSGLTAITNKEIRALSVRTTPTAWDYKTELTNKQVRDTKGVLPQIAAAAATRFLEDVTDVFAGKFYNANTTAHPENAVVGSPYAANGGGTVYMADVYDMTFVNGGTKTQQNFYQLQLGDTSLATIVQNRVDYRERGGERASMPGEKPFLVTGPSKMVLGQDLAEQEGRIYDGTGLQSGWRNRVAGTVLLPSFGTDGWALVWRRQHTAYGPNGETIAFTRCPVWVHMRLLPKFRLFQGDKNTIAAIGEAEYAIGYFPFEGDFALSKP